MLAHITDTLTTLITNLYVATGLFGIILAMAIESCCIPLPSEIVMPLAGILIASGKLLHGTNSTASLLLVAFAGAVGCLLGSIAAYGIGYSGGRPLMLKYGRYLLISQHDADKADAFFQRWGSATAFFSRLLPVVRTYISLPAGISKMPFVKFCIYTFLGSFPWCLLLAFLGIQLGNHLDTLSPIFHSLDVVILVVIVILVVLYIRRHIKHDRIARAAASAQMGSQTLGSQNTPQSWQQQSTPFSQNQYQQPSQNPQQNQYQQQVRQFQPPQQGNQSEWNQQQFPPQQNWPPAADDRTIRR
ncbi:MAG: hypothetical protein NVS4B1_04440 [Ktedonobacteraceae bacterium]